MAELTTFSYRPDSTALHRLDPRGKLISLFTINLTCLNSQLSALLIMTCVLLFLFVLGRSSIISLFREIRYFFIPLMAIFLARGVSTPGVELVGFRGVIISQEGVWLGLLVSGRLLIVVLVASLFILTTSPSEITAAVEWCLKPLPGVPEKRVAIMIGLMLRFTPVILKRASDISDAQRARGVENRKNPVFRISVLIIPLLKAVFSAADQLVLAMESRCYTEERSGFRLQFTSRDYWTLVALITFCVALLTLL